MLLRILRSLGRAAEAPPDGHDSPIAVAKRLERAHDAAPIDAHLEIAYGGMKIGDRDLLELVQRALQDSGTGVPPRKRLHRPLASFFLAQYYLYALAIEGARAECGVFAGTSALIACRAARTRVPGYTGADLHLIDSFQGLDEPSKEDRLERPEWSAAAPQSKGDYAAPIELARATLAEFPGITFHEGWIPAVFAELPESTWAFVHLDVDHYAPTRASLAYFYPRLAHGGVILCDDYGAPMFPGAHRAWDAYCEENAIPYVVLDTGQSVILKP